MKNDTKEILDDGSFKKTFEKNTEYSEQELRSYEILAGSGIVPEIYEIGSNFVIMERGLPLCKHLPTSIQFKRSYRESLIDLVNRLHSHGFAHRDLHVENLILCNGDLRIIDFEFSTMDIGEYPYDLFGPGDDTAAVPEMHSVLGIKNGVWWDAENSMTETLGSVFGPLDLIKGSD